MSMKREQHANTSKTEVKVWEYFYRVRVPYLQSRTNEDIRRTGVNVTGIPSIDNDIKNQLVTCMLPIAYMIDYYRNGVHVLIPASTDIKDIYDTISDHLYAWKKMIEYGINIGDAPVDDLIEMDRFANSVYDYAKYQFTPDILNSLIANQMNAIQRVNASNFFANTNKFETNADGITMINGENIPERESLADMFKNRLVFRGRR